MRTRLLMLVVELIAVCVALVAFAVLVSVWWAVLVAAVLVVVVVEIWSSRI